MLIKNGLVAGEDGARQADIRICGERISETGAALLPEEGEKIIDAGGLFILPGGVDAHTHMDLDLGHVRATDDFLTGTIAAACGGTTTIIDHMAFGTLGCTVTSRVDAYHRLAEGKAVVDYGFHGVIDRVDRSVLNELKTLADEGVTSHKFYLTYDRKLSDGEVMMLMESASDLGIMLAVHAENDEIITRLREEYRGRPEPIYHARSRPPESEAEAVERMIRFAHATGEPRLYIVHLSTGTGLECLKSARERGHKNLFIETCPQYLLLDETLYLGEDGLKYVMSPPLRSADNCQALWTGLKNGDINVIATDHCPFYYNREKQLGKEDFTKTPGGAPGVEARIPLMFSEMRKGRLTVGELVSLCCANPARLFGLYPKKGVIAPGSDADIVMIDPSAEVILSFSMLHENTDYTPYDGFGLKGYPVKTISRGEVIVENGEFTGHPGRGRFLKRGLPDQEKKL